MALHYLLMLKRGEEIKSLALVEYIGERGGWKLHTNPTLLETKIKDRDDVI